ncbi:MAG: hypothetical protein ABIK65_14530 [Candidatus Eisenbacteria bacterium]
MRRNRFRIFFAAAALVLGGALLRVPGCLDADPLGPAGSGADLSVTVTVMVEKGAGKTAAPDSLKIALYDVTESPYTDSPETFPLGARGSWAPTYTDDGTGAHFNALLRVDLLDSREFRVVTRLSHDGTGSGGRAAADGERTVRLGPGDRKRLSMVLTPEGAPGAGEYGLAVGRSTAAPGARHGIPIILKNGSPIGGLQFQLRFDESVIDSVVGIEVDPSSRLYLGEVSGADSLIGTRFARPTDSTLRVLTVDLRPAEGDTLLDPVRSIPAGNDLIFLVSVDLADAFPALPAAVRLSLEDVFFSTPSGSTDIAVTDTAGAFLTIAE